MTVTENADIEAVGLGRCGHCRYWAPGEAQRWGRPRGWGLCRRLEFRCPSLPTPDDPAARVMADCWCTSADGHAVRVYTHATFGCTLFECAQGA